MPETDDTRAGSGSSTFAPHPKAPARTPLNRSMRRTGCERVRDPALVSGVASRLARFDENSHRDASFGVGSS